MLGPFIRDSSFFASDVRVVQMVRPTTRVFALRICKANSMRNYPLLPFVRSPTLAPTFGHFFKAALSARRQHLLIRSAECFIIVALPPFPPTCLHSHHTRRVATSFLLAKRVIDASMRRYCNAPQRIKQWSRAELQLGRKIVGCWLSCRTPAILICSWQ